MRGISTTWVTWTGLCLYLWLLLASVSAFPLPQDGVTVGSDLETAEPPQGPGIVERIKNKDNDGLSVVQSALLNFLRPMPIVDTITEEEKYGNDGDKFNRVGKSIVGGVERVSEFVNRVTNIPVESVKKLSRGATEVLNNIGGRLVGLQR